jgi:hypothetical protein
LFVVSACFASTVDGGMDVEGVGVGVGVGVGDGVGVEEGGVEVVVEVGGEIGVGEVGLLPPDVLANLAGTRGICVVDLRAGGLRERTRSMAGCHSSW